MCKWNVTHLNIEPPKKSKYGVSSKGFPLDQFSEYLAQGYFDLMQSIMDGFLCKKWTPWYLPVLPARTCAGRNWRTLAEAVWGPCRCWGCLLNQVDFTRIQAFPRCVYWCLPICLWYIPQNSYVCLCMVARLFGIAFQFLFVWAIYYRLR